MATRHAVLSGVWSNNTEVWDGDHSVPSSGDTIVVDAAVNLQVDTNATIAGASIITGGATPGMLYWKNGSSGTITISTGGTLSGTLDTNKGRLLANSDGSWATDTALAYATKQLISLAGTAEITAANLDIKFKPAAVTNKYARCYGTKYDFAYTAVSIANDTLDLGTTPPSAGTQVRFKSTGTLPGGLTVETDYYVRSISGNTCKLGLQAADATIVNLTSQGTGTHTIYTGFASGSATVNVLDDVTADNWTVGDTVVIADEGPSNYDTQIFTISEKNAGTIVLSTTVTAAKMPGAKIWLSTRNCSIQHSNATSTSQKIINGGTGGYFGEIRATGSSTPGAYCRGIESGTSHTVDIVSCCNTNIYNSTSCTITTSLAPYTGLGTCTDCTVTNAVGGYNGLNTCTTCTATTVQGNTYGLNTCYGCTTTTVQGNQYGLGTCYSCTTTTVQGNQYGLNSCYGCTTTTVQGNNSGLNTCNGCTATTAQGNTNCIRNSSGIVKNLNTNVYDFYQFCDVMVESGGTVPAVPTGYGQNTDGMVGWIYFDNFQSYGVSKIIQMFGEAFTIAAGGGTPTPNQRAGGGATLIEMSGLLSNLNSSNTLIAWKPGAVRVYATEDVEKTYKFYIQSTMDLSNTEISLTGKYFDSESDSDTAIATSTNSITDRGADLDCWTYYLSVTITPQKTGWIVFDITLKKYGSSERVYIDPLMVIS